MRHTFDSEQWLPYPIEQVFAFFANPENLPRLMPKWQKARIEEASFAPPPPRPATPNPIRIAIAAGAGTRTVDGSPTPGTLLRDHVVYELPLGPLGEIANTLVMQRQFRSIFNFRHKRTAELLPRMFPASATPLT